MSLFRPTGDCKVIRHPHEACISVSKLPLNLMVQKPGEISSTEMELGSHSWTDCLALTFHVGSVLKTMRDSSKPGMVLDLTPNERLRNTNKFVYNYM